MSAKVQKPMSYVGGGMGMAQAVLALHEFLAATRMPAIRTLKGLGTVEVDYPCYPGMLGVHDTKATNFVVRECDLLIAVGTRFDDWMIGKPDAFISHASIVHMDVNPAEMSKLRRAHVTLQGDLNVLSPVLQRPLNIDDWQQYCAQLRDERAWCYGHPGDAIYAPLLLKQLPDRKSAGCIMTTDVEQHQTRATQHIVHTRPENFITSSDLGAMGFGSPTAAGTQVTRSNDTVACISGDDSSMMNVQELGTVKRKQLPLEITLLDN